MRPLASPASKVSLSFVLVAELCVPFADLGVSTVDPWAILGQMGLGLLTPSLTTVAVPLEAIAMTVAFALWGVVIAAAAGFVLASVFHLVWVRGGCAFVRSIHELFWALIFLQIFGLHPLTGVLAVAVPYAGIFAKVYSEILEETEAAVRPWFPRGSGAVSVFLFAQSIWPGVVNTLLLTQIALVGCGGLALLLFPLVSRYLSRTPARGAGHLLLVIFRSIPEYILAFILLHALGPSMLPAALALALHNGAIIGYLIGRHSNALVLRPDHGRGLNLYAFELVPRLYGQFLAFLFYRWEIIFRETAIVGILGVQSLGFFVDNAMQALRFDQAFALILVTGFLNLGIDAVSRVIRGSLRLSRASDCGPVAAYKETGRDEFAQPESNLAMRPAQGINT